MMTIRYEVRRQKDSGALPGVVATPLWLPRGAGGLAEIDIWRQSGRLSPSASADHYPESVSAPILPLWGEAKAVSPRLLVKRRSPSAAALHIGIKAAFAWLLLACMCLSPVGRAQAPAKRSTPSFEQLKAKAEAARDTDQTDEALRHYGQLVKMRPNWSEGWWHIGALNYDRDRYSPARDGFTKFVLLEPKNGQGWGMLGLCEYQLKQYLNSLQHLAKARSLGLGGNEELSRVVQYHQALLLNLGEQFEAAMAILRVFAVQKQETPAVLDAIGLSMLRIPGPVSSLSAEDQTMVREFGKATFLRAQNQPEALQMFQTLEAKYRGRPNVAYAYGVALLKETGGSEKALEQFKKELERDPNHVPAMLQYGFETLAQNRPGDALPYAKKAAELSPKNFVAFYLEGKVYLKLNDVTLGVRALEEARVLAPASSKVLYALAQAYFRAGRKEDAAKTREEFDKTRELEKRQAAVLPFSEEEEP